MPTYSTGNTRTTFTCTSGTRQEIVTHIETKLVAAGWSVVSGGAGNVGGTGTDNVVLRSAVPSGGAAMQLKVVDPGGSANCAVLTIRQTAGGNESQQFFLLTGAGKVYNVVACQYQAFIFTGAGGTTAREYFGCGVLAVPSWLQASVTEAIWAQGNATSDTDSTVAGCLRNSLGAVNSNVQSTARYRWSCIMNGTLLNRSATAAVPTACDMSLCISGPGIIPGSVSAHRFADNTSFQIDPWFACGVTGSTDEAKYRGMLWDGAVISDTFAAGTSKTVDGHTMYALTDNCNTAVGVGMGTLFLM
jgi:hypothetical protein